MRGAEAVARVVELDRAACELDAEALFAHGVEVALDELLLLLPDGGGEGAEDVEVGLGEGGLRVAGLAAYAALDLERAGAEVDEDAVGDPAARDNRLDALLAHASSLSAAAAAAQEPVEERRADAEGVALAAGGVVAEVVGAERAQEATAAGPVVDAVVDRLVGEVGEEAAGEGDGPAREERADDRREGEHGEGGLPGGGGEPARVVGREVVVLVDEQAEAAGALAVAGEVEEEAVHGVLERGPEEGASEGRAEVGEAQRARGFEGPGEGGAGEHAERERVRAGQGLGPAGPEEAHARALAGAERALEGLPGGVGEHLRSMGATGGGAHGRVGCRRVGAPTPA